MCPYGPLTADQLCGVIAPLAVTRLVEGEFLAAAKIVGVLVILVQPLVAAAAICRVREKLIMMAPRMESMWLISGECRVVRWVNSRQQTG